MLCGFVTEEAAGHLSSFFRELGVVVHDLHVVELLSVLQDFCFQTVQLALECQTLLLKWNRWEKGGIERERTENMDVKRERGFWIMKGCDHKRTAATL